MCRKQHLHVAPRTGGISRILSCPGIRLTRYRRYWILETLMPKDQALVTERITAGVDTHNDLHVAAIVDTHDRFVRSE